MAGPDLVRSVYLKIIADDKTERKRDELDAWAAAWTRLDPTLKPQIDAAVTEAKAKLLQQSIKRIFADPVKQEIKPDINTGLWQRTFAKIFGGGGGLASILFGAGNSHSFQSGGGVGGFFQGALKFFNSFGISGWLTAVGVLGAGFNVIGAAAAGILAAMQGIGAFAALAYPQVSKLMGAFTGGAKALSGLSGAEQTIVLGARGIYAEFLKISGAFAPVVDQILNVFTQNRQAANPGFGKLFGQGGPGSGAQGPGILQQILEDLLPFAKATAPVLLALANAFNRFLSSPGAAAFQALMVKLAPGVLLAIGTGLGRLVIDVGKLLEVFSHGNTAVNVIKGIFGAIDAVITIITVFVTVWNKAWDLIGSPVFKAVVYVVKQLLVAGREFKVLGGAVGKAVKDVIGAVGWMQDHMLLLFGRIGHDVSNWANNTYNWLQKVVGWWHRLPGDIKSALSSLGSSLYTIGRALIDGLVRGIRDGANSALHAVLSWVTSLIPKWKGPLGTDQRLLRPSGKAIIQGLVLGLGDGVPGLHTALNSVTTTIGGGLGAGGGRGGRGGRGLPPLIIEFRGFGGVADAVLREALKNAIFHWGGGGPNSVQIALGQRH